MKTSPHLTATPNDEKGFTLIEVMIAMGVFAIGILAVAAMQITAFQGNRSARLQTEAVTLASQRLEEVASEPYDSLADGSETVRDFDLDWSVTDNTPIAKTKTIIMTASWDDRSGQKTADFSYIISDPN